MGVFSQWQPTYAAHGVATFPVTLDEHGKRPAVRGYLRAGRYASKKFASKFTDANALGFAVKPSRITVLDVDTPDENVLAAALDKHGRSPLIVRSQSGNFQAYYRNNNEGRHVRPWVGLPIDVLGDGFAVAPPSEGYKGRYEIIEGDLNVLAELPTMRGWTGVQTEPANDVENIPESVGCGERNRHLFGQTMRQAHTCNTEAELMAAASKYAAATFTPALDRTEIQRVVASAWRYTVRGENYAGIRRTQLTNAEIDALAQHPDALYLLIILRRWHWGRTFVISDAMADEGVVPFHVNRLRAARKHLKTAGYLVEIRRPSSKYGPALYVWPD